MANINKYSLRQSMSACVGTSSTLTYTCLMEKVARYQFRPRTLPCFALSVRGNSPRVILTWPEPTGNPCFLAFVSKRNTALTNRLRSGEQDCREQRLWKSDRMHSKPQISMYQRISLLPCLSNVPYIDEDSE